MSFFVVAAKSQILHFNQQVSPQDLCFKDGRLNKRKLAELPYHLAKAGMWRDFHREIVCNIEFLVARAKAFSITELRMDLMRMLKQRYELTEEYKEEEEEDRPPTEVNEKEEKGDEVQEGEEVKADENINENDEKTNTDQKETADDLFLTENKKQGPNALPVQEETTAEEDGKEDESKRTPVDIESIKGPEILVDLATVLKDIEILIDILTLGVSAIRQDANNIAAQV